MKKIIAAVFGAVLLLGVTACSNSNDNAGQSNTGETNQTENQNDNQAVENEDTDMNTENDSEQSADESNNEADSNEDNGDNNNNDNEADDSIPSEIADFEEADQLAETIDNLGSLKPDIKTDNPNKRIILFSDDNGKKEYKSIYIKEKSRLKIVELNKDDGLLFNEEI